MCHSLRDDLRPLRVKLSAAETQHGEHGSGRRGRQNTRDALQNIVIRCVKSEHEGRHAEFHVEFCDTAPDHVAETGEGLDWHDFYRAQGHQVNLRPVVYERAQRVESPFCGPVQCYPACGEGQCY